MRMTRKMAESQSNERIFIDIIASCDRETDGKFEKAGAGSASQKWDFFIYPFWFIIRKLKLTCIDFNIDINVAIFTSLSCFCESVSGEAVSGYELGLELCFGFFNF